MRRTMTSENTVVVGQIDKSAMEILRVERLRLNSHELVSLKVFSCGSYGKTKAGTGEKGVSLHLDKWREIIPMIQQALEIQFPAKPQRKPARVPTASKQIPFDVHALAIKEHCHECSGQSPADCPIKSCPLFPHRMGIAGEGITTDGEAQQKHDASRRPSKTVPGESS